MQAIQKTSILPYTPKQMFNLVNAVEDYPKFLHWCEASEILSQNEDEVIATLHLTTGGIKKSFTTRNLLKPYQMIEIQLINGPFKHLEGYWQFESLEEGKCLVQLDLRFEFLNHLFSMLIGPVFKQIATTLVDAFQKRADEIYGNH
jgi:ribosome-associated toxin RatA of RatAB toxin-antitoxin module